MACAANPDHKRLNRYHPISRRRSLGRRRMGNRPQILVRRGNPIFDLSPQLLIR